MIFGKINPVRVEIDELTSKIVRARGVNKFALLPVAIGDDTWVWLEEYVEYERIYYAPLGMIIDGKEVTKNDIDVQSDGPKYMRYPMREMFGGRYDKIIYKKSLSLMIDRLSDLNGSSTHTRGMYL